MELQAEGKGKRCLDGVQCSEPLCQGAEWVLVLREQSEDIGKNCVRVFPR